ncbi:MAG: hypothetical protein LBF65_00020 [Holosporales bacterium]|jgi:hypothetical protein|nr:hypothetical protein [Holosporales bacterium]
MSHVFKTIAVASAFCHQIFASYFVSYTVNPEDVRVVAPSNVHTPLVNHPCEHSDAYDVILHDGYPLNFTSRDFTGKFIRRASGVNLIPNPLGFSHTGAVVIATPQEVIEILDHLSDPTNHTSGYTPQPRSLELMRERLGEFPGDTLIPFCLEANGTPGQVMSGVLPHVQITPLAQSVAEYNGNVYVRQLSTPVPHHLMIEFIRRNLGRPYEGVSTFKTLLRSTLDKNQSEDTSRVFCSECVALLYRQTLGLNIPNVSNIIPEEFGSAAGEHDVLRGYAGDEIQLKLQFIYDEGYDSCCCRPKCLLL